MQNLKQRIISFVMLCTMLIGIITLAPGHVQAAESDFVIKNGVLKEYKGSDKNIKIPDGVEKIGNRVFFLKPIKSVVIPSSVKSIGKEAFGLTNLKKLTIPESVKKIGIGALFGCSKLKEVTVLNKKLKFLSDEYGRSVFDGGMSGYNRTKITIKGYEGSTAEKLVKQLNERDPYASPVRRFKEAVFKPIKK